VEMIERPTNDEVGKAVKTLLRKGGAHA
jgi:hypothetical protein